MVEILRLIFEMYMLGCAFFKNTATLFNLMVIFCLAAIDFYAIDILFVQDL